MVTSALTERVEHVDDRFRLHLPGGRTLEADRLLVATGRKPNVEGLGFEIDFTARASTYERPKRPGSSSSSPTPRAACSSEPWTSARRRGSGSGS